MVEVPRTFPGNSSPVRLSMGRRRLPVQPLTRLRSWRRHRVLAASRNRVSLLDKACCMSSRWTSSSPRGAARCRCCDDVGAQEHFRREPSTGARYRRRYDAADGARFSLRRAEVILAVGASRITHTTAAEVPSELRLHTLRSTRRISTRDRAGAQPIPATQCSCSAIVVRSSRASPWKTGNRVRHW